MKSLVDIYMMHKNRHSPFDQGCVRRILTLALGFRAIELEFRDWGGLVFWVGLG